MPRGRGHRKNSSQRPHSPPTPQYPWQKIWTLRQILEYLTMVCGDSFQNLFFGQVVDLNTRLLVRVGTFRCTVSGYFPPDAVKLCCYSRNRVYGAFINRSSHLIILIKSLSFRELVQDIVESTQLVPYGISELITFNHGSEAVNQIYHPEGFGLTPTLNCFEYRTICSEFGAWFPTGKICLIPIPNRRPRPSFESL